MVNHHEIDDDEPTIGEIDAAFRRMTPILARHNPQRFGTVDLEAIAVRFNEPIPVLRIRTGMEDEKVGEITALRVDGDKLLAEFSNPKCDDYLVSAELRFFPCRLVSVALLGFRSAIGEICKLTAHETLGDEWDGIDLRPEEQPIIR